MFCLIYDKILLMSNSFRDPSGKNITILSDTGYPEQTLIEFASSRSKVLSLLSSVSLIYSDNSGQVKFPAEVRSQDETADTELADRAFRRRVVIHTLSAGLTMRLLLNLINEVEVKLTSSQIEIASQVVALHGLYKIMEIKTRSVFDSDKASDISNDHLLDMLRKANFPEEFIPLAINNSHMAAKDYIMCSRSSWDILRMCAYLSDELLQENVIQPDCLAKVRRLMLDPRYEELNKSGFPECSDLEDFTRDGILVPKYRIQELATKLISEKIANLLHLSSADLGKYLIYRAQTAGIYTAVIRVEKNQISNQLPS